MNAVIRQAATASAPLATFADHPDLTDRPQLAPLVALRAAMLADIGTGTARDLSARQLAVMLEVRLVLGPHTVRGLSAALEVSKPAITRALDRLEEYGFASRRIDPADRRSVLVSLTAAGHRHLDLVLRAMESAQ